MLIFVLFECPLQQFPMFTGTVHVKICEACGLRPTDFQKRHNMTFGKPDDQPIDPYVSIDVDENHLDRSTTKPKTFDPVWNEYFVHDVRDAMTLGLTVFHDAAIPPDDFVANCSISFEELLSRDKDAADFWVSTMIYVHVVPVSVRPPAAPAAQLLRNWDTRRQRTPSAAADLSVPAGAVRLMLCILRSHCNDRPRFFLY